MRKLLALVVASVFALRVAGEVAAKVMSFQGTVESKLAAGRRFKYPSEGGGHAGVIDTGVATLNNSSGGGLLHYLRIADLPGGSSFSPVTDPDTSGTIPVIGNIATILTATLGDFQTGLNQGNTLAIRGVSRLCLLSAPPCSTPFDIPLSLNSANTAVGVGGLLTGGGFGSLRISIQAGPWTIGTGTAVNQTQEGNFKTVSQHGFIHGATSNPGSTASPSGVIQLISPMQVETLGAGDNNEFQSLFTIWTIRLVPEPGFLLLLGAGVVGIGILGRNRMRG
jgi:hypothetical protein